MGTPEKPTFRGTTRRLKAIQDLQALDSKATGLQVTDLWVSAKNKKASAKNKSKLQNLNMEADGKMYHCSGCKQKFNKASIAKFCPLKNICRMCIHAQRSQTWKNKLAVFSTVETNWKQLMPSCNSKQVNFNGNICKCFQ